MLDLKEPHFMKYLENDGALTCGTDLQSDKIERIGFYVVCQSINFRKYISRGWAHLLDTQEYKLGNRSNKHFLFQ